jgi:hypothetical protein
MLERTERVERQARLGELIVAYQTEIPRLEAQP